MKRVPVLLMLPKYSQIKSDSLPFQPFSNSDILQPKLQESVVLMTEDRHVTGSQTLAVIIVLF